MIVLIQSVSLALFFVATGALAVYGLHLYVLIYLFRRRVRAARARQSEIVRAWSVQPPSGPWPLVTSQIPIYNEIDVAERVIRSVCAIRYPAGRHEVQILDDSDDDTRMLIDRLAAELTEDGHDVHVVRRAVREGYKAGALAYATPMATGEFIAIFDSDFVPPANFLERAVPLLAHDSGLACLQGRWAHLNESESWLTRAQALGIDGHFAIEQGARAWNGLLMNFNGTAGVWRKAVLVDEAVGGWRGDTLTEDLDLSYRAQLAGWRIEYSTDLPCPAELPGHIDAFKSQQRRWATGSIQTAVKLMPRILRSRLTVGQKVEAFLHLTHYSVAVWMLVLAIVARPMLFMRLDGSLPVSRWIWGLWIVVLLSAIAPAGMYTYARWTLGGGFSGVRMIPRMMALGCGMCVNNALAVVRGLTTRGGEFVRTPKSGSEIKHAVRSTYAPVQTHMWVIELALGIYSMATFFVYVTGELWPVSVFLLIYGLGFLALAWMSMPRWWRTPRVDRSDMDRSNMDRSGLNGVGVSQLKPRPCGPLLEGAGVGVSSEAGRVATVSD